MVETTLSKVEVDTQNARPGLTKLHLAKQTLKRDRKQGLAELNQLFRSGKVPQPSLDGRYAGELVALDIAPGLTEFFQWLTNQWLPWLGKAFDSARHSGDNVFMQDSFWLARFFNPLYRGFVMDKSAAYRCFTFHTYMAPGLTDPDRPVLKIDYDLKENPSLTVRRILGELVQIDHNLYLGKAHVHWWFGGWQKVAYFLLFKASNTV
jgi:hypothetical protein